MVDKWKFNAQKKKKKNSGNSVLFIISFYPFLLLTFFPEVITGYFLAYNCDVYEPSLVIATMRAPPDHGPGPWHENLIIHLMGPLIDGAL